MVPASLQNGTHRCKASVNKESREAASSMCLGVMGLLWGEPCSTVISSSELPLLGFSKPDAEEPHFYGCCWSQSGRWFLAGT